MTLAGEAFHADDAKPLETTIENAMHAYLITFSVTHQIRYSGSLKRLLLDRNNDRKKDEKIRQDSLRVSGGDRVPVG